MSSSALTPASSRSKPSVSEPSAVEAIAERLKNDNPLDAWAWASKRSEERLFFKMALKRRLEDKELSSEGDPLGGSAQAWREAGAACARWVMSAVEHPEDREGFAMGFLNAPREEMFEGAASVIPESVWLGWAGSRVRESGLGHATTRQFHRAFMVFGANFQRELMELDWNGHVRFPQWSGSSIGHRQLKEQSGSCGLCVMAGWESDEPLREAERFLTAKGLDIGAQLISNEGTGSALVFAVTNLRPACTRFILSRAPGVSALESCKDTLELWRSAWESVFDAKRADQMLLERLSFAEGMDLERALSRSDAPAVLPRRAGL